MSGSTLSFFWFLLVRMKKKLSQKTSRKTDMKVPANKRTVKTKVSDTTSGKYRPINAY